jgi:beta-lactamase regulating signal transducer with metallopeptidase domain
MKKLALKFLTVITLLLLAIFSMPVLADCSSCSGSNLSTQQAVQCGSSCASGSNQTPAQANTQVNNTVKNIVNILSVVVGIIAVIMIVIGGFRYVTSGGKQESVAAAKNTILYALIGLIIAAMAQVLVRFILFHATNNTPK